MFALCSKKKKPPQNIENIEMLCLATLRNIMMAMDIMGPFPETRNKNKYVLVTSDNFT